MITESMITSLLLPRPMAGTKKFGLGNKTKGDLFEVHWKKVIRKQSESSAGTSWSFANFCDNVIWTRRVERVTSYP